MVDAGAVALSRSPSMRIHAVSFRPFSEAQLARLERCGELHCFDLPLGDDRLGECVQGAEIVVIKPRLDRDITPYLDKCSFISWQGTGTDALDLDACRERGIVVSNVPDFSTDAVVEHAYALLLAAAKRIEDGRPVLREGRWQDALAYFTVGLKGKTLGLFGCGKIGLRIAEIAHAFGMRPVATVRDPRKKRPVDVVLFDKLLEISDFLVIAAPATEATAGIFDRDAFRRMKPSALLVNVSRGALVNERDLLAAVNDGEIAGAALDVFEREPPDRADPVLAHPKIVVSPHVAWGTEDAVERLLDVSIDNVEAYLRGTPTNVVT